MSEWKTYKLVDICSKIGSGATPRGGREAYFETEEYSLIRSQNVLDFSFSKNGLAFISEEQAKELRNVTIERDDILLNITGDSVARVCQVPDEILPARVNQHVAIIRGDNTIVNQKYLKYYLLEPSFKGYMLGMSSSGATRNALTKVMIENFDIKLPDLTTQTQIAQILTSLDDKIELNLQMNQTLEAMAQALFKEWFVNFNFPNFDGVLENGLPKGWKMGKVGEILQPKRGRNITKAEAIEGVFPVVAGGLEPSCYHNESNTKEPVITISSSGANAGFVRLYQMPVWSADSCFIDSSIFPFVHYCYIFLKSNQKNIYDSQEGSAQPHIYPRHIMDLNICVGNESVVQQFEEIVTPLFEKIKYNSLQIQTLTQTRDTLLPKLMSGKIEIKN